MEDIFFDSGNKNPDKINQVDLCGHMFSNKSILCSRCLGTTKMICKVCLGNGCIGSGSCYGGYVKCDYDSCLGGVIRLDQIECIFCSKRP
jgi:hypothetical protein